MTPSLEVLEARLAEVQGHFNLMAVLCEQSSEAIDRRDETIARQVAMLDQRDAQIVEMEHQRRLAQREVERLRRVCRAAGVEWRTGVTS